MSSWNKALWPPRVKMLLVVAAIMLFGTLLLRSVRRTPVAATGAPDIGDLFAVPNRMVAHAEALALARLSRENVDLLALPAASLDRSRMFQLLDSFAAWKKAATAASLEGDALSLNEQLVFHFLMPIYGDRNFERVLGVFLHCPRTFSPAVFDQNVAVPLPPKRAMRGRSFLELGTGSGYISVLAARSGASPVVALDVNADAVLCARRNAQLARVPVECFESDLFAAVPNRRFDVIYFNIPWGADKMGPEAASWERALTGGRALLHRLLHEGKDHLTYRGAIYLVILLAEAQGGAEMWAGEFATLVQRYGWRSKVLSSMRSADLVNGDGHVALVRLRVRA